jgi:PadR family transcriptional regulator, regulatory protein PadR
MDEDKELYGGLIRLHILHHADGKPIFGHWIITELQRHGYRLSPGTLYPLLHGLVRKGYLKPLAERRERHGRRTYAITATGRHALKAAKRRVSELFGELFEPDSHPVKSGAKPKIKRGAGEAPGTGKSRREPTPPLRP